MDSNHANSPVYQYCLIKVDTKLFSNKIDFKVDIGQQTDDLADAINQKTLEISQYHNIVDGLNYLSTLGWEIVHVNYQEFSGTTYNNPQYLLKRRVNG